MEAQKWSGVVPGRIIDYAQRMLLDHSAGAQWVRNPAEKRSEPAECCVGRLGL